MTDYDRSKLRPVSELNSSRCAQWAYRKWEELNNEFFDGFLRPGPIEWGVPPAGHRLGFFDSTRNAIILSDKLVKEGPDGWQDGTLYGERLTADVILHEMLHQAIYQLDFTEYIEVDHNTQIWCDYVSRISNHKLKISLKAKPLPVTYKEDGEAVYGAPADGYASFSVIARWPYSIRPSGYYEQSAIRRFGRLASM